MAKMKRQPEDDTDARQIGTQGRRMVRRLVPEIAEAVSRARKDRTGVEISIAGLEMTPEVLYLCIWYASDQGVPVTFMPWARRITTADARPRTRCPRRAT
jgi:hypothetical protein